jgi:hypothetical protein
MTVHEFCGKKLDDKSSKNEILRRYFSLRADTRREFRAELLKMPVIRQQESIGDFLTRLHIRDIICRYALIQT